MGKVTPRTSLRRGFWSGAAAAIAMLAATFAIRFTVGTLSPTELTVEWLTTVIPLRLFSQILSLLEFYAKPLLFVSLLIVQTLGGGFGGAVYGLVLRWWAAKGKPVANDESQSWSNSPVQGLMLGLLVWLVTMLLFMPVVGGGVFGTQARSNPWATALSHLAVSMVYGLTLALTYERLSTPRTSQLATPTAADKRRRRLLWLLGIGILAVEIGAFAWQSLPSLASLNPKKPKRDSLLPEITPNEDFYEVSKNIIDPTVDASTWRLEISGLVERPVALTLEELRDLPAKDVIITLECISNPVGGNLMSNARWKGVPLRHLLEMAGVKPAVIDIAFYAVEGYSESIPRRKAEEPDVLVAYEMNGEVLPQAHGFPVRLVVPDIYGMKSVKWLTRIEPVSRDYLGYWQVREWDDKAQVKTTSRIDLPLPNDQLPVRPITMGGVAFSGARGISKVEISIDGGKTWREARLKEALSPYSWVFWTDDWTPAVPARYNLKVRATDGTGAAQIADIMPPLPDGASGYDSIWVTIIQDANP